MAEKMNLGERLLEIRKALPYLQKTAKGFGYDYVPGSAVLAVVVGKMNEMGVMLVPSFVPGTRHIEALKYSTKSGQEKQGYLVHADMVMTFFCVDTPEDRLEVSWIHAGFQDDPSQAFGSGLTYAERYFLLKFFNVPTDKDDPDRFVEEKGSPQMKRQVEESRHADDPQVAAGLLKSIAACNDLPTLKSLWLKNVKVVKDLSNGFRAELEKAKDARKDALATAGGGSLA